MDFLRFLPRKPAAAAAMVLAAWADDDDGAQFVPEVAGEETEHASVPEHAGRARKAELLHGLILASAQGSSSSIASLVTQGAPVDGRLPRPPASSQPLRSGLAQGEPERIPDPFNHHSLTPLHWAVLANRPSAVKLLLTQGALGHHRSSMALTPLQLGVVLGRPTRTCCRILLTHDRTVGKSVAIPSEEPGPGPEPPTVANGTPRPETATTAAASASALTGAAGAATGPAARRRRRRPSLVNGRPPAIPTSFKGVAYLNQQTGRDGWAALHWASCYGDASSVDLLLQAGADIEQRDWQGRTPLAIAAEAGRAETVRRLVVGGADMVCQTPQVVPALAPPRGVGRSPAGIERASTAGALLRAGEPLQPPSAARRPTTAADSHVQLGAGGAGPSEAAAGGREARAETPAGVAAPAMTPLLSAARAGHGTVVEMMVTGAVLDLYPPQQLRGAAAPRTGEEQAILGISISPQQGRR